MKRDDRSPEAYREDVDGEQRQMLERIRQAIFEVDPEISEGIDYGMLAYSGIGNLAAQKHYVSLYVNPKVLDQYRGRLAANCGKSCVRYRRLKDIDQDLLLELLKAIVDSRE